MAKSRPIRPTAEITPAQQLSAVPIPNPQVQQRSLENGGISLTLPRRLKKLAALLPRFCRGRLRKSFHLDADGARVWAACDGQRSVQQILQLVCPQMAFPTPQAQARTMLFLKMLLSKGLIAMAVARSA